MTSAELVGLGAVLLAGVGLIGTILAAGMRLGVLARTVNQVKEQMDNLRCSQHVVGLAAHTSQLARHTEQLALHTAKLATHAKQTAETSAVLVGLLKRLDHLNGESA